MTAQSAKEDAASSNAAGGAGATAASPPSAPARDASARRNVFAATPRFALVDDEEIERSAAPLWCIEDTLPANALAVVFGEKGSLKTFLLLMWALHVSLGLDWHGKKVRSGVVVYVYAEGRTGIGPRMAALKRYYGVGKLGILFLPRRVTLNDADDVQALLEAIAARTPLADVALIVIDTLNRNMLGNENSSEDMSRFVQGCDMLREATKRATVAVAHHKGHGDSERSRGSSVLEAAADTVIHCTRDDDRLTLECKKQKDAAEFAPLALEVFPVASSLVLKPSGATAGGLKGQRLLCLQVLHDNYTDGGASYSAWEKVAGLSASSFNKAREWLKANSYVKSDGGKWKMTDAGRLALHSLDSINSTDSTTTTRLHSGAQSNYSTSSGGFIEPPAVELDHSRRNGAAVPDSSEHGELALFDYGRDKPDALAAGL